MLNFYNLSYYQNLFSETIPNSTSINNLILIISIIMASIIAISIVVFIIVKIKRKKKINSNLEIIKLRKTRT